MTKWSLFQECKCPSTGEWINKLWASYTMEYCSAIKRNQPAIQITMSMNLKGIVLRERNQTQKPTYCMIPFL